MDDFESALTGFTDAGNVAIWQGGMPSIDVPDDIGIGGEDDIFTDESGAGDRGPTGVNGALNAVFARPSNHCACGFGVFDASKADFSEQGDAGFGEVFEVLFLHSVFDDGCAGVDFDASGSEIFVAALGGDGEGLEADDIFGASGEMDFAGGDHRCDSAIER